VTAVDDAITGEIVRNGLAVAAEEASIVVVRAGHSSHIQEGADACAAVLDAGGQLVALSTATSLMHAASLRCSLPSLIADFPLTTIALECDAEPTQDTLFVRENKPREGV